MKSFKDKARLAQRLSLSDWLILIRAWWMLLFFHLALKWVSYDRLKSSTRPVPVEIADSASVLLVAQKYQRLVLWASRLHVMPMTCLVKSLTLRWMLDRRNTPAQLCIGVTKTLNGIQAHAWVEVMGEIIGEAEEIPDRFTVLESPAG